VLHLDPHHPPSDPKDAATVVVMRDRSPAGIDIFFVRRHAKSPFLGGAVVFPGGKLDADDASDLALERCVGTPQRAEPMARDPQHGRALGVCACRELLEEAALALTHPPVTDAECEQMRGEIDSGQKIASILGSRDLVFELSALHGFARWITPAAESRRYDARFFLARAPTAQTGKHDARETTSSVWATPEKMLAASDAGEVFLAPPTIRCLELLAPANSVEAAFAKIGRAHV
jgi:8-oxo-dGTP pyrophosphatase MutT (NUDIX family)